MPDRYCIHQQLFAHICVCVCVVGNNEMHLLNEAAISPRSNALSNSCESPMIVCAQSIGHLPLGPRSDVKTVSSMSNQAGCNLLSFFTMSVPAQQVTSFWMRSGGLATSPEKPAPDVCSRSEDACVRHCRCSDARVCVRVCVIFYALIDSESVY